MSQGLVQNGVGSRKRPMFRIAAARGLQLLGWPGVLGMVLLAGTAVWLFASWAERRAVEPSAQRVVAPTAASFVAVRELELAPVPLNLPHRGDVQRLLAQISLAAKASDLGWPAAEYRVNAATADRPAVLEVRFTLKGPYPKLRRMLVQVMHKIPAAHLREFALVRANSEVADVEARLSIGVFLADEATASGNAEQVEVTR